MRSLTIPAVAMAVLISVPAMAQQSQQDKQGQQMQMNQGMQKSGEQSGKQWDRQSVRSQLEKAGFNNVQVLDTSFLVSAEVEGGQEVLMVVNPPPGAESGAMGGMGGSGSGSSGAGMGGSGSTKK